MVGKFKLRRFCVLCGRDTEHAREGLCDECYNLRFPKIKIKSGEIDTNVCECGRIEINGKWKFFENDDKLVETFLKKNITVREDVIFHVTYNLTESGMNVKLIEDESMKTLGSFSMNFKRKKCPVCASLLGGYYEAILQIRGSKNFVSRMIQLVYSVMEKEEKNERAFITEMKETARGVDLKLGSKRLASQIVGLAKRYKDVEIKYSKKLKTRKKGRDVFRYTFLIREVEYETGKKQC